MKEQLVTFKTAKLAKEKGFNEPLTKVYNILGELWDSHYPTMKNDDVDSGASCTAPTQSLLQKFIREERGVHIEIIRNNFGYQWLMCRSDGRINLGWSDDYEPNNSGVWDSFEDALEDALLTQLSYDLPDDLSVIKYWGNYAEFAIKNKTK